MHRSETDPVWDYAPTSANLTLGVGTLLGCGYYKWDALPAFAQCVLLPPDLAFGGSWQISMLPAKRHKLLHQIFCTLALLRWSSSIIILQPWNILWNSMKRLSGNMSDSMVPSFHMYRYCDLHARDAINNQRLEEPLKTEWIFASCPSLKCTPLAITHSQPSTARLPLSCAVSP